MRMQNYLKLTVLKFIIVVQKYTTFKKNILKKIYTLRSRDIYLLCVCIWLYY